MFTNQRFRSPRALLALLCVSTLVLAACGNDDDKQDPTPQITQTPLLSLTSPSGASTATEAPAATPAPGELTVGQIADGIAVAWPSVTSMRATTESTLVFPVASPIASPVASPIAVPSSRTSVEEVIFPDRRHVVEGANGATTPELVLVDKVIYFTGITGFETSSATPIAFDPSIWTVLDPVTMPEGSPYRSLYEDLSRMPVAPYSNLVDDQRDRIARPLGQVTVSGRQCAAYRIADTNLIGERVEIVISLRDDGLPCSIETRTAGSVNVTTYEFNIELTIEPPI